MVKSTPYIKGFNGIPLVPEDSSFKKSQFGVRLVIHRQNPSQLPLPKLSLPFNILISQPVSMLSAIEKQLE